MQGPYDGKLTKYYFGHQHGSKSFSGWEVEAETLDKAILRFRVGCLFPFRYADKRWWVPREGKSPEDYLRDEDVVGAKPGAVIDVRASGKVVATIPVESDEVTVDPRSLLPPQAIEALEATAETTAIELSRQPQALQGLQTADRREITRRALEIELVIQRLEIEKREMQRQVKALQTEVDERLKRIWMIELYIGSHEAVTQLAEGEPAPADEPITVRQQTLCMDEEIAVWAWHHRPELLEGKKAFDYNNIEDFDRWLAEDPSHLAQVFPERKGIVALRVRRREKKHNYGNDYASVMQSMEENEANRRTYLLIRNGGNLYRLWVDTVIWPRFFPRRDEMDFAKRQEEDHFFNGEKARREMEGYLRGLVVLQGLLDRSTLFQPLPTGVKINVFDPEHAERYLRLIRDDEPALVADTSILHWREYRKWLGAQIRVGARVLYDGPCRSGSDEKLYDRTGVQSLGAWPGRGEVYVVEEVLEERRGFGQYGEISFLYLPGDEVYESRGRWGGKVYDPHPRKTRVRFWAYRDEAVPVDAVSIRYLNHLVNDRSQRSDYYDSFLILHHWKRVREAEEAREVPFVDLVLRQAGLDPRDPASAEEAHRCRRLVRWWKLKTKVGRVLEVDESKALRMVLAAFKRGQDYDDDPEKGLPVPQHVKKVS